MQKSLEKSFYLKKIKKQSVHHFAYHHGTPKEQSPFALTQRNAQTTSHF